MITTVREFADNFRALVGDSTESTLESFFINGINWCLRELPLTPKLGKIFSKHIQANMDAKGHYKWKLNDSFRKISDITMMNFYSNTGGEPCRLPICYMPTEEFYNRNGIISLKKAGRPCYFTYESDGDDLYLILDRPSNIPIIVDYIAYGFPKPVKSMDDKLEIDAIAEHLMTMALRTVFYQEADDFAFAGAIYDYLDSKYLPEAIQALNKRFGATAPIILGEV